MQTIKRLAAMLVLAAVVQSTASAQVQFYNGDLDGQDGRSSESTPGYIEAMVYENFTISGSGMYVTGIFGTFLSNSAWTSADWEVRSGITPGNGGSLLFSGTGAAPRIFTGASLGNNVYESGVTGLSFFLAPGEYWFGLAPIGTTTGVQTFLATTSGLNGVNSNLDGNSYFNSSTHLANFVNNLNGANNNYSLGIESRVAESTVPEPATMTLLATGLAGLAGARRRKRVNG